MTYVLSTEYTETTKQQLLKYLSVCVSVYLFAFNPKCTKETNKILCMYIMHSILFYVPLLGKGLLSMRESTQIDLDTFLIKYANRCYCSYIIL